MPNYKLSYTRDTSIIIQEAWFRAHTMGLGKIFDWVNPYEVPTIYVVTDGVIEVWDDEQAYGWIRDQLQREVEKRPDMMEELAKQYEGHLRMLDALCAKGCPTTAKAFLDYLEMLLDAIIHFTVIYHIGADERTPAAARTIALRVREKDVLFDTHDRIIRECLQSVYPELRGFETVIRYREVKYNQGLSLSKEELKNRKEGWIVVPGEFYELGSLESFKQKHPTYQFQREVVKEGKELQGQVAFAGTVRGTVRIVKRKDQVNQLQAGEILVSPMTTPDFIPAMKQAAAFITDEGGVTCHAAIIAREMHKPCIIGTRVATKWLKDGDHVEIDGERGIVRKIS